jgi:hypothetical protein
MKSLAGRGGVVGDIVSNVTTQVGNPATNVTFALTRKRIDLSTFTPTVVYSNTATSFNPTTTTWQPMDFGSFQDPTTHAYARCVLAIDPLSITGSTGTWVTVRSYLTPATPADSASGTFPLIPQNFGTYPRVFYHAYRMGIWQVNSSTTTDGFQASDQDVLSVSDQLVPTAGASIPAYFTPPNYASFYPEMGTVTGAWGSISTGEYVGIYFEGGAFLVYGDLYNFSSTVKLPGVTGTAGMMWPGALTPSGLIYTRLNDGAYVWNGDNVSQKISTQIPDDQFLRTKPPGFEQSSANTTSMAVFGQFVVFPNNWTYDTLTQSWWLIEDPTVLNLQVWCSSPLGLFGSPGYATAATGVSATLNTYYWSFTNAVSSYFWLSNPLPITQDALVSIQLIEIVASNPTATAATITILPQVPVNQRPLQQQNGNQPLTFTIPANTVAFRGSQRLGYTDYNVQLSVTSANTNSSNAAPILHELNVGYTVTRTAGVQ